MDEKNMGKKRNIKLRFHLGRGDHYMHWQLKRGDIPTYWDPGITCFKLENVTLYNRRKDAENIYQGANKTVCAWLSSDGGVSMSPMKFDVEGMERISYNPRKLPYWTWEKTQGKLGSENLDGRVFKKVIINNTKIYVK